MRKVLLLIVTLFLVTVFAGARTNDWSTNDWYNQVLLIQTEQCRLEKNAIGQPPMMLAGNNMITEGQQPGPDLFGMQAAQPSHSDFYNAVLVEQVDEYRAENESNWAAPTLLAGNNMITGGQASPGREGQDFYNRVLAANRGEFQTENDSIGAGPLLLANMITGEKVVLAPEEKAPEDFYNQTLSAQVTDYNIDNNAIAPSNTEFAESQPLTIVPGSMASNVGGSSERDWYQRTVAMQAELNRRLKKSQAPNSF